MKEKMEKNLMKIANVGKYIYAILMVYVLSATTAMAENGDGSGDGSGDGGAGTAWTTVIGFIGKWVPKLGAAVVFIGAIEFALAFKSEDPEGKTKGVRTIVAGIMVIAIPTALNEILK